MKIKDLTRIALFVAIIIVCSYISVPFTVPVTLQVLGVFLAALVLGKNKGSFAVLVYIMLGICGVPVFAGMKGGLTAFLTPVGGYLIAFPVCAYFVGLICEKTGKKLIACFLGLAICYIFAYIWCIAFYHTDAVILTVILPFIVPDILKIIAAVYLSDKLKADFTA